MFADFSTTLAMVGAGFGLVMWLVIMTTCLAAKAVGRAMREDVKRQGGAKGWAKRSAVKAGGMLLTRAIKRLFG